MYVPPEPEKMKVLIWGKELCNMAEWNDFLKCVEEKTEENKQLKQQLAEKQNTINEINKEFVQAVHDWKALCAEKDKEIESIKQQLEETNAGYDFTYEQSTEAIKELKQNQTQLAIQELERVKILLQNAINYEGYTFVGIYDAVNNQIKELKGE